MRGKQMKSACMITAAGITPAHAGKTVQPFSCKEVSQDHPRACGENTFNAASGISLKGSPPRMRGKLQLLGFYKFAHRITPAHAGKTMSTPYVLSGARDHPRACGENLQGGILIDTPEGSPPRMRGKQWLLKSLVRCRRITPAHAGKTDVGYNLLLFP